MNAEVDFSTSGIAGLEALRARNMAEAVPRHVHAGWCLLIVERGRRYFRLGGSELSVNSGQMAVIPPGLAHECWSAPGWGCDYRVLSLSRELLAGLLETRPSPSLGPWVGKVLDGLVEVHDRIIRGQNPGLEDDLLDLTARVFSAPGVMGPVEGSPKAASRAVREAKAILDGMAERDLTLGELASLVGVSPFHLSRRFTREVGVPPHAYLTLARLRLARGLLARGLPLADTALACGFYDQSHFCLRFKQYMGASPGRLRRAVT
jgi:AraC-like DNA-binding protein